MTDNLHEYGKYDSWTTLNEQIAVKKTDTDFFKNHESGVPAGICWFFGAQRLSKENRKTQIKLNYKGQLYSGYISLGTITRTQEYKKSYGNKVAGNNTVLTVAKKQRTG